MDTPLTDAEEFQREGSAMWIVKAGFARNLERKVQQLESDKRELVEALEEIAKGYSGEIGNCQSLSGTDCVDIARSALFKHKAQS